jgi:hypothetical protein
MSTIQTRSLLETRIVQFLARLRDDGFHSKGDSEPERDCFSDDEWDQIIKVRHQLHILVGMLNRVPTDA